MKPDKKSRQTITNTVDFLPISGRMIWMIYETVNADDKETN